MQKNDTSTAAPDGSHCGSALPSGGGDIGGQAPAAIAFTWDQTHNVVSGLARRVAADGTPDVIVAIQRGGLVPGVMLSHALGIRSLISFNIRRTAHDGIAAPKSPPIAGANISFAELGGKDVLVIDDIAGSGVTLDVVRRTLLDCRPRRLRTMVCVVNRTNWDVGQSTSPDEAITYVGEELRGWVVFPWERNAR